MINTTKRKNPYNIRDKTVLRQNYINRFLNVLSSQFKYNSLPDTIPSRVLETFLNMNGNVFLTEHGGKPYCFTGALGGELNQYGEPTIYTIANPYFNITENAVIDVDGVLMRNNSQGVGTIELLETPIALLIENTISEYNAIINTRSSQTIIASTSQAKATAERYLNEIEAGTNGILGDNPFIESIKVNNADRPSGNIKNLIENNQYLISEVANISGFDYAYNMKRERLNVAETEKGYEFVLATAYDRLEMRKEAIAKFNEMFGFNVSVDFNEYFEKTVAREVDTVPYPHDSEVNENE